jgi:hypothetical protein
MTGADLHLQGEGRGRVPEVTGGDLQPQPCLPKALPPFGRHAEVTEEWLGEQMVVPSSGIDEFRVISHTSLVHARIAESANLGAARSNWSASSQGVAWCAISQHG